MASHSRAPTGVVRHTRRPRWIAIRQTKLAIDARDAVYGGRTRPLSRARRAQWARLVAWFVRSRAVRYRDVLAAARTVGRDLREQFGNVDPVDERTDSYCRRALRDRLAQLARVRRSLVVAPSREELAELRMEAWHKQRALDGYCPLCAAPLPCNECGIAACVLDGHGGLCPA